MSKRCYTDYIYLEELLVFKNKIQQIIFNMNKEDHKVILCSHYVADVDLLEFAESINNKYMKCYIEFKDNNCRYIHLKTEKV